MAPWLPVSIEIQRHVGTALGTQTVDIGHPKIIRPGSPLIAIE
jgi:hypothetical protein